MKFVIKTKSCEEGDSILPDNSYQEEDFSSMNSDTQHSHEPGVIAPKRTINESGAIVLTPGTEGEPSHILGDTLADDDTLAIDEPPNKKKRTGRGKKFRNEWLTFDMFKGWLKAHPNPERAMCTACNIVLNAGKSELEKHATSIKHQKRMIEYRRNPQRFDFDSSNTPNVILVDSVAEGDDGVDSSYIQRHGWYQQMCFSGTFRQ